MVDEQSDPKGPIERFSGEGSILRFTLFCAVGVGVAVLAGQFFNGPDEIVEVAHSEEVIELTFNYEALQWDEATGEVFLVGTCGEFRQLGELELDARGDQLVVFVDEELIEPDQEAVDLRLC